MSLKATRLLSSQTEGLRVAFTFRMTADHGIFAITCPARSFSVDAMRIRIQPQ
jgi:hypothetical protein